LFVYYRAKAVKRPEGMHREVFALLYNDNKDAPPLLPTDTGLYLSESCRFVFLNKLLLQELATSK